MVSSRTWGLSVVTKQSLPWQDLFLCVKCLRLVPFPAACRCFISASSEKQKSANSVSLKRLIAGWIFHCRWRIRPQEMWFRVSGKTQNHLFVQLQNEVSNSVGCSSVSWGVESQRLLCLCWHHSSHSLMQYSVSCCVFLGMQTFLCLLSPVLLPKVCCCWL